MRALEHRTLPGLGTEVSAIGAGCWTIGGPATNQGVPIGWDNVDPDNAYAGLVRAHELGVTLYDTADVYGLGRSERLLGRLLREMNRSDLTICSKVGYFTGTADHPYRPAQMYCQLATTLDNLGTDQLDIYHLHSNDFGPDDQYLLDAVEMMCELKTQGVIRAVGMRAPHTFAEEWATTNRPDAAATARWLHLFHTIQPDVITVRYNLLSPLYHPDETDIFTFARKHAVGVIVKQVLGHGLLLHPQPDTPMTFSAGDHRCTDPLFTAENRRLLATRLAPLRARYGTSPSEMARIALGYVLQRVPDTIVLVGFRNAAQITTTLTSLGDPLGDAEIADIQTLLHPTTSRERTNRVRDIEVEKKFALPNPHKLKAVLEQLGGKPAEPTHQIDAYYNAPHRDFLAPDTISEWLRLRTEERGSSINYKLWHPVDARVKTHADEYETTVSDIDTMRKLLEVLGFQPLVTVDKTREEWRLPDVEVVFDHVVDAGDFVEFEYKGDAETVEDATTQLNEFIAALNVELGAPINRGYPHILLGRDH